MTLILDAGQFQVQYSPQVRGYKERILEMDRERENVLSVAALCASALEEGWEGLQPVKATSTNCVIDHSRGQ